MIDILVRNKKFTTATYKNIYSSDLDNVININKTPKNSRNRINTIITPNKPTRHNINVTFDC